MQTRGRRPRGSTRTPRWYHLAEGMASGGPRVSGPKLEYWGNNALALNRPLFNRGIVFFFLRRGLSSRGVDLCRRCGRAAGVGFDRDDKDRVDPSPRDHQWSTCVKYGLSSCDRGLTW